MTRPGYVMVEHPIGEAESILAVLQSVPGMMMKESARAGVERLERAVNIERGPGGSSQSSDQPADVAA